MKRALKAVVIGLDSVITKSILRYVEQGKLPNLEKLIQNSTWANNCLVPLPTITPPNWTTIATGAWPGTHGITDFHMPDKPGIANRLLLAFRSTDCKAEFIWKAAERAGKKSIIFDWPVTWPPTIRSGIQIGGGGCTINEWRISHENMPYESWDARFTISSDQLFSTEELPQAFLIELKEASGWRGPSKGLKDLEAEIRLQYREPMDRVEEKVWYLLVRDSEGEGYDKVTLSKSKREGDSLTVLSVGEWSERLVEEFKTDRGVKKGAFRCKLLELSKDGSSLKLYFTPICQLDGWAFPEEMAKELEELDSFPLPFHGPYLAYSLGWFGPLNAKQTNETLLEITDFVHKWYGEAVSHLLKSHDWDLFFMHVHTTDFWYHLLRGRLDIALVQAAGGNEEDLAVFQWAELELLRSADRMIGRILEAVDKDTLIIVTSDHGADSHYPILIERKVVPPNIHKILEEAGLTVYKEDPETGKRVIDWSRTKALAQRSTYIYVNLKGRDPHGVVEPGEEFEHVCEQVIQALYNHTDPITGKKPISLALRRKDARMLGLCGDMVGDIVYATNEGFGYAHGQKIPTAEYGIGSLKGLLIMAGPNIKKNFRLDRTVWLTDIVPTICYLTETPIPRNCEGGIIYQALEDPDLKLRELETCRENYRRIKEAFEKEIELTHTYTELTGAS